jgi:pimeloyl-ACP methyl ester carboxylesterase
MPIGFPKPLVDRATGIGRELGRRNLRWPKLAEMWRSYSSLAGAQNRSAFVRTMRGVIEPGGQTVNASDRLYLAAHVPTLIVWGDHDGIIPVEHAYTAHELIPTSRLEIMEGVGHFPHVEAPEEFCEVLLDFLATTSAGSTDDESLREILLQGG